MSDLIAIDTDGRLLAVEVKPAVSSSITWAAAQAMVYANLFRRWIDRDEEAVVILRGMLEQRRLLGLAPETNPSIPTHPVVVPVVALQRGASAEYVRRLFAVHRSLQEKGIGENSAGLEVYSVTMAGRLDPIRILDS